MIYHRTANSLLTVCLTPGDKPTFCIFLCAYLCVLCIAIPKKSVVIHRFHAALDNCATVACCAADMAVIATRPKLVRR